MSSISSAFSAISQSTRQIDHSKTSSFQPTGSKAAHLAQAVYARTMESPIPVTQYSFDDISVTNRSPSPDLPDPTPSVPPTTSSNSSSSASSSRNTTPSFLSPTPARFSTSFLDEEDVIVSIGEQPPINEIGKTIFEPTPLARIQEEKESAETSPPMPAISVEETISDELVELRLNIQADKPKCRPMNLKSDAKDIFFDFEYKSFMQSKESPSIAFHLQLLKSRLENNKLDTIDQLSETRFFRNFSFLTHTPTAEELNLFPPVGQLVSKEIDDRTERNLDASITKDLDQALWRVYNGFESQLLDYIRVIRIFSEDIEVEMATGSFTPTSNNLRGRENLLPLIRHFSYFPGGPIAASILNYAVSVIKMLENEVSQRPDSTLSKYFHEEMKKIYSVYESYLADSIEAVQASTEKIKAEINAGTFTIDSGALKSREKFIPHISHFYNKSKPIDIQTSFESMIKMLRDEISMLEEKQLDRTVALNHLNKLLSI